MMGRMGRWALGVAGLLAATWAWAAMPGDAGLPTMVSGEVSCKRAEAEATEPLVPFMKLRSGDAITLSDGATLQIVYFEGGRRETWTGPAVLVVGDTSATQESGEDPQVDDQGDSVGKRLESLPALIKRETRDRAGQTVARSSSSGGNGPALTIATALDGGEEDAVAVADLDFDDDEISGDLLDEAGGAVAGASTGRSTRADRKGKGGRKGGKKSPAATEATAAPDPVPTPEAPPAGVLLNEAERADIEAAYALYETQRAAAADEDILPEILLATVLAEYNQWGALAVQEEKAKARCSTCAWPFPEASE